MKRSQPRIVVIGGGTGAPTINEGLIRASHSPTDIVAVSDNGGITGRMRTDSRGQDIAVSDAFRCMLSLINPKALKDPKVQAALQPLKIRTPIRQIGYEIVYLMSKNVSKLGFKEMQKWLCQLTGYPLSGEVLPVTTEFTNIIAKTSSGRTLIGEQELDFERMSKDLIIDAHLNPPVKAFPAAIEALKNSNAIISSFGSLIGSVLINFCVPEIKTAYQKSQARKIYITNLVSTRNETHGFSPEDFIHLFQKYTGLKHPLDLLIVPDMTRQEFENKFPQAAIRYDQQHAHFLGWPKEQIKQSEKKLGVKIITHSAVIITKTSTGDYVARHDPQKLAQTLKKVLTNL